MKKTILIALLAISCFTCFSQINFMPYGSFVRNLNRENRTNTYGAGIRLEFSKEEAELSKFLGVAYARLMYNSQLLVARAYNNWTDPSYVDVTARYTRPLVRLEAGLNYYIAGEAANFKGFNFYLNGGLEAIYIGNKAEYSYYDKELYNLGYTDDSDGNEDGSAEYDLNLHLNVGAGIEKSFGPGNFFLQTTIAFPAPVKSNIDGASQTEDFVPTPFNINIGYKIPLGKK